MLYSFVWPMRGEGVYAPTIRLLPYSLITDFAGTADRLADYVAGARSRLQVDFPAVVRRYADPETARESLFQTADRMDAAPGDFGAYIVYVDGEVSGVASFQQVCVTRRRGLSLPGFGRNTTLHDGVLLAMWLRQIPRQRPVLPLVLAQSGKILAQHRNLTGYPCTLVRPGRTEVINPLLAATTGYGGFTARTQPTNFSPMDGVRKRRVLYVAQNDMDELRRQYGLN